MCASVSTNPKRQTLMFLPSLDDSADGSSMFKDCIRCRIPTDRKHGLRLGLCRACRDARHARCIVCAAHCHFSHGERKVCNSCVSVIDELYSLGFPADGGHEDVRDAGDTWDAAPNPNRSGTGTGALVAAEHGTRRSKNSAGSGTTFNDGTHVGTPRASRHRGKHATHTHTNTHSAVPKHVSAAGLKRSRHLLPGGSTAASATRSHSSRSSHLLRPSAAISATSTSEAKSASPGTRTAATTSSMVPRAEHQTMGPGATLSVGVGASMAPTPGKWAQTSRRCRTWKEKQTLRWQKKKQAVVKAEAAHDLSATFARMHERRAKTQEQFRWVGKSSGGKGGGAGDGTGWRFVPSAYTKKKPVADMGDVTRFAMLVKANLAIRIKNRLGSDTTDTSDTSGTSVLAAAPGGKPTKRPWKLAPMAKVKTKHREW